MGARPCRYMSDQLGAMVVSVDYAKSPRYPYPHALLQIPYVIKWAVEHEPEVDVSNIIIGGGSAGANLAASFAILLGCVDVEGWKNGASMSVLPRGVGLCALYLLCPSLNQAVPYRTRLRTTSEDAKKKSLPAWLASGMEDAYLPPPISRTIATVSPSIVSLDMLKTVIEAERFPPTLVSVTAELDCLSTEGKMFAEKVKSAGAQVHHSEWKGATHGFTQDWASKGDVDRSDAYGAWKETVHHLEEALASIRRTQCTQ
jgi:acetyl esterase